MYQVSFENIDYNFKLKPTADINTRSYAKLRTRNHRLPCETGRWSNIPYENRKCTRCNSTIGDEYHYIIECPDFLNLRNTLIKPVFYVRPNYVNFLNLFMGTNENEFKKLSIFIKHILKSFNT